MGRTLVGVGLSTALLALSAATPAAASAATTSHYVDCSAKSNGTGARSKPWNSTAAVNAHRPFTAGSRILLRSGTMCTGTLTPHGSGRAGRPITLGAYGRGPRPIVRAADGQETALTLTNQSWWTIAGLEFSGGTRRGVYVTVTSGIARGITLRNLTVHGVAGSKLDSKNTGLVVISPTHYIGNWVSARFDQVLVDNVVAHDTTMWAGIIVGTATSADLWDWQEGERSTNVTVRNSTVHHTYGDGIVLFAVGNGLIEHSVAHDTGLEPTQTIGTPNGIWSWACNDCVVQYNEAYRNNSPGADGGGFDIDFHSRNSVVQYNYGHDNSAYCVGIFGAEGYPMIDAVVRYNVCANNGTEAGTVQEEVYLAVWNHGTIDGIQIYGNTFVTAYGALRATNFNGYGSIYSGTRPNAFKNNIVYATTRDPLGPGDSVFPAANPPSDYNVWYSTVGPWTNREPHSVYADPQLVRPGHTGVGHPGNAYDLRRTSPAINAGTPIADSGGRDFRGHRVPRGGAFDIGAVEFGCPPANNGHASTAAGSPTSDPAISQRSKHSPCRPRR
ncbi:MAG TPA: right-handed parallel beta-helix repeat-containing protein [Actinoplanes sp.]